MLSRMRREQHGFVMVTVLLVVFVLILAGAAIVNRAVGSQNISRRDQDWNAALAAAEAGIDDYIYRLNNSSLIPPSPVGNNAISPSWAPVPGPTNPGSFSYLVTDNLAFDGTIRLTVSGKVNNVVRTIEATVRRKSFLDFLYFTDFETRDPALYTGSPFTAAEAQVECARHYYDTPPRNPQCLDITFITQDTINGPLHTNDALRLAGNPTFNGNTSTSWNTTPPRYRCPGGGCNPTFARVGDPAFVQPLTLPPTNTSLKATAQQAAPNNGCLYTGPTSITLNSNGTMNVESPWTTLPEVTDDNCATGSNLPLPPNGVVYVQTVPAGVPSAPPTCPYSDSRFGVAQPHPLGYPVPSDATTYGCRDGDVFLSGTLQGQLTIAAENDIVVVGNVTYSGGVTGSDLLGLIPNEYVWIYHPVTAGGSNITGANGVLTNPVINAAMLSIQHSFAVQNYWRGAPLGTLSVTGTIGQRYRGAVGTFSGSPPVIQTGYAKNYVYDTRLKYLSPPHFLDPVQTAWGVVTWAECPPKNPPTLTC